MFERIIVVTKKTALEELLARHHSRGQVQFFLERRGSSIAEYEDADRAYRAAEETVLRSTPRDFPREILPREMVANFLFRQTDLVVAIGPDGLAVNVLKYLPDGLPLLTVNPDPARVDGVLMRFRPENARDALAAMLANEHRVNSITLAEAKTNDGQTLLAVNDFLVGRRDQVSARYTIAYRGTRERQSSSGVLVCTGTGSTGWMSSVVAGAHAIAGSPSGPRPVPFPAESHALIFAVREPFISRATNAGVVFGKIESGETLEILSEMPDGGALFSDGVPEDAIEFNAGASVSIRVSDRRATIVAPLGRG